MKIDLLELKKNSKKIENPQISDGIDFFNAKAIGKLENISVSEDVVIKETLNLVLDFNKN